MAVFRIANMTANAALDALAALIPGGTLRFYDGAMPATANAAVTGNLLGTLTFATPAAPAAMGRSLTFNTILEETSADRAGLATYARAFDAGGNPAFDADVGDPTNNPTAVIQMDDANIALGGPIRILSFLISYPA